MTNMTNKVNMKSSIVQIFLKLSIAFIFIFIISGLALAGLLSYISFDLPDVRKLATYGPPLPSQILSQDGEVLLNMGREKRDLVDIKDIPKLIVDAFLCAEDSKFFEHSGVDYLGMIRALIADIRAGKIVQGGSTITQQVAKSLLLTKEKSFGRKIKDILLAQKIEEVFTKKEILYLYLNHVYLGGGYYGVKAAFQGYFDKHLSEATIAEAALIAGLLVAPGKYSPYVSPEYAKIRQKYVLKRMFEEDKINEKEYQAGIGQSLKIRLPKDNELNAGYFTDWVRQRVINVIGEEKFLTGGFKIVTTIDSSLQKSAEASVLQGVKNIDKRQGYKGPLKRLKNEKDIFEYIKNYRKNFFEENSQYFILKADGNKQYEIDYQEEEYQNLITKENTLKFGKDQQHFESGIINDRLEGFLKKKQNYEAVVLKVSDLQKLIYISVGGVKGIIPSKNFSWAHKRVINEGVNYQSPANQPSKIVSRGDVIFASLEEGPVSFWENLDQEYKKNLKDSELIEHIKSQNFYIFKLDQDPEVQGALVSIEPLTGKIISLVGGSDFFKSQFNRATQSKRQPGSSFKPILFALGLEEGFTPSDIIVDSPEALGGADDNIAWKPKNYDGEFQGAMTFRTALEQSRNVPTIKIAADIGIKKMLSFCDRIGLNAKLEQDLSMALGSFGVTLLDLVYSYAIFPNGGRRVAPKSIISITDRFGKSYPVQDFENQIPELKQVKNNKNDLNSKKRSVEKDNSYLESLGGDRVYDTRLAYIMTNILKGVIQHGTGSETRDLSGNIAGKTGTTNNYVDAWFIGFSPKIIAGVWTGFDDNKTLGWAETGARAALPIWKEYMRSILKKYGNQEFSVPKGIVNVLIDKKTGKLVTGEASHAFLESFVEGTEPGRKTKKNINQQPEFNDILEGDEYFLSQ